MVLQIPPLEMDGFKKQPISNKINMSPYTVFIGGILGHSFAMLAAIVNSKRDGSWAV